MNLSEEFFSGPGGTKDMNLEKDFILREMAGEYVIIPTGKRAPVQEGDHSHRKKSPCPGRAPYGQ